jgi:tRNA modification GTPase
LYLFDAETENQEDVHQQAIEFKAEYPEARLIVVANKLDLFAKLDLSFPEDIQSCAISALDKTGLEELTKMLYESVAQQQISDVIVSNLRHYESLHAALKALHTVEESLELGISTELIASDIREANYHLGTITGEITHEDLLDHIFSKFCIGK